MTDAKIRTEQTFPSMTESLRDTDLTKHVRVSLVFHIIAQTLFACFDED